MAAADRHEVTLPGTRAIVSVPKAQRQPTAENIPTQVKVRLEWATRPRDDEKKLVFGTLDNEAVNDCDGRLELGSELAVA